MNQHALPTVILAFALVAPALGAPALVAAALPAPSPAEVLGYDPGVETGVPSVPAAPDQLLAPPQQAAEASLESLTAALMAFQEALDAEGALDPDWAGQVEPAAFVVGATEAADAGLVAANDEAALLVPLADVWTSYAADATAALWPWATGPVLSEFDGGSNLATGMVVLVEPQSPDPVTEAPDGLPVAALRDGKYHFTFRAFDLAGLPVPIGAWTLEILGLQVLPGESRAEVPEVAGVTTPVVALTTLFTLRHDGPTKGAVATPCEPDGCLAIGVPAGPLKLQRLYAGSQVFVRFTPDEALGPGWHNPAAAAAYALSATEPALDSLPAVETPAIPWSDPGVPNSLKPYEQVVARILAQQHRVEPGATKRSLVLADVLDQFPMPVLLAPQNAAIDGGHTGGQPDGPAPLPELPTVDPDTLLDALLDFDLDGWSNLFELALNSDPQDDTSTPGSDDEFDPQTLEPAPDGIPNFAEDSRAHAVGLSDFPGALGDVQARVSLAGIAVVGTEAFPTHAVLDTAKSTFENVPLMDFGVAGPATFQLENLTLANGASDRVLAGPDAGLQQLRLFLHGSTSPIAAWAFDGAQWVPDELTAGNFELSCNGSPPCGGDATSWDLRFTPPFEANHFVRFFLDGTFEPREPAPGQLDGFGFQGVVDVQDIDLVSLNDVLPREGVAIGTEAVIEVVVSRIDVGEHSTETQAGLAVDLGFCAVDDLGNRDVDVHEFLLAYEQGGEPSPSGMPPTDLTEPFAATLGCAEVPLSLFNATDGIDVPTIVSAAAGGNPSVPPGLTGTLAVVPGPIVDLRIDAASLTLVRAFSDRSPLEEGFDLTTLTAFGQDAYDNELPPVASDWTPDEDLAAGVAPLSGEAVYAVTSSEGGIAGQLCAAAVADAGVEDCVTFEFHGRDPPTVLATCSLSATPQAPGLFEICVDANDDVSVVAVEASVDTAAGSLPALPLEQGPDGLYRASFALPADDHGIYDIQVVARDADGGIVIADRPVGGDSTPAVLEVARPLVSITAPQQDAALPTRTPELTLSLSDNEPITPERLTLLLGATTIAIPAFPPALTVDLSVPLPVPADGRHTVEVRLLDPFGLEDDGAVEFLVDTTPPTVTVPVDIVEEATGPDGAAVAFAPPPSALDAIDGVLEPTCDWESGDVFPLARTPVTCTAKDNLDHTGTAVFNVTVEDTTPPTIDPVDDIVKEATGPLGAVVTFSSPTASDLVDIEGVALCSRDSGSTFPLGATTVTCTATDTHGNPAIPETFDVTVRDTTKPNLTVPGDLVRPAVNASGAAVTFVTSATDAVDGVVVPVCSPASGATFPLGNTTVTCTATDGALNPDTKSFVVSVVDTGRPVLHLPGPIVAEATDALGAVVTYEATATDVVDGDLPVTCTPASGSRFALDATVAVACSATDANGNTEPGLFDVTVLDRTAPTIAAVADKVAEAAGALGAAVTFASPATLDLVDGAGSATCSPAGGFQFPLGNTTVTCTAADAHGNAATPVTFTVTVQDTTGPVLTLPGDIAANATGPEGAAVSFSPAPSALDAVDGPRAVTCSPASGSVFALGQTEVTCTSTDSRGNSGSGTFRVRVGDSASPVLALPPDLVAEATGAAGAAVAFSPEPTADDAVDGALPVTCSPASGSVFALGETEVACSATDGSNNTATGSFRVTVQDRTPPVIAGLVDLALEATGADGAVATFEATATDLVDGAVVVACAPASGSVFPLGITPVTCTATDSRSNLGVGSFDVTVVDTTPPAVVFVVPDAGALLGVSSVSVRFRVTDNHVVEAADLALAVDGSLVEVTYTAIAGGLEGSADLAALADSAHSLVVNATDATGNPAGGTRGFEVDTVGPDVAITSPAEGALLGSAEVTLAFTLEDAHAVTAECIVDGGAPEACTSPLTVPLSDGPHTIEVVATDAAGHTGTASVAFGVDAHALVLAIANPLPGALLGGGAVAVEATATDLGGVDAGSVELRRNGVNVSFSLGGNATARTVAATLPGLLDGEHNLVLRAADLNGLVEERTLTFTIDATAPAADLEIPSLVRATQDAVVDVSDLHLDHWNLSVVTVGGVATLLHESSTAAAALAVPWATEGFPDGIYTVRLQASDGAGNAALVERTATVDNTAPLAAMLALPAFQGDPAFPAAWAQSDGADAVRYEVQFRLPHLPAFADWTSFTATDATGASFNLTERAPGVNLSLAHLVEFRVHATTDAAGNVGLSAAGAQATTTVDAAAPLVRLTSPAPNAFVGGVVAIEGKAGRAGQALQEWRLDLVAGGTVTNLVRNATGRDGVLLAWPTGVLADGLRTLRLNVTNLAGRSDQVELPVRLDNTPPTVTNLQGDAAHSAAGAWTNVRTGSFTWTAADGGSGVNASATTCELRRSGIVRLPVPGCAQGAALALDAGGFQGFQTFVVLARDAAGNVGESAGYPLRLDTSGPVLSNVVPPAGLAEGATGALSVQAIDLRSGVSAVTLHLTSPARPAAPMAGVVNTFSASVGPFSPGKVEYHFTARDAAGNTVTFPATGSLNFSVADTTPPSIQLRKPTATTLAGLVPVEVALADAAGGLASARVDLLNAANVSVAGGAFALGAVPLPPAATPGLVLDVSTVANGAYRLQVTAADANLNAARSALAVTVANAPEVQAPVATPDSDGTLTIDVQVAGSATQVTLRHALPGAELQTAAMTSAGGGAWSHTITGLRQGDVVNYFVEASDGIASGRFPATGVLTASIPIDEAVLTELSAWEDVATVSTEALRESDHSYVNITQAQFTHDTVTGTFAFELEGPFVPEASPVPVYLVEFRSDPTQPEETPSLILNATYAVVDGTLAWSARAHDAAGTALGFPLAVVPGTQSLAMQVAVADLVAQFPGGALGSVEVRFVARGSLAQTGFTLFDIQEPAPTLDPPGPLDNTDTTLELTATVADNDAANLQDLTAQLEVVANGVLTVVPGELDVDTGVLTFPALGDLLPLDPGLVELTLTAIDGAGNSAQIGLPPIPVGDVVAPELVGSSIAPAGSSGVSLLPDVPRAVDSHTDLRFVAQLADAVGIGEATLVVDGVAVPLSAEADGLAATLRFTVPGRHTLSLAAADLAGNLLPETRFLLDVVDIAPPVLGAVLLRPAGAVFDPDAPTLTLLDLGSAAPIVSVGITDDDPAGVAAASVTVLQGTAVVCASLPLAPRADDAGRFEGPLDCALPSGTLTLRVGAEDAAGNDALPVVALLTVIDRAAPVVSIVGLPAVLFDVDTPTTTFTITATDLGGITGLTVDLVPVQALDLEPFEPGATTLTRTLTLPALQAGQYRLDVTASDDLNTVTVSESLPVGDLLPPALQLDAGTPGPGTVTPSKAVRLAGTVRDATGVDRASFRLLVDGAPAPNLTLDYTEDGKGLRFDARLVLAKGRHTLALDARDVNGRVTAPLYAFFVEEMPAVEAITDAPAAPPPPPPAPSPRPPPRSEPVRPTATTPPPPPVSVPAPTLAQAGATATVTFDSPDTAIEAVRLQAEAPVSGGRVVARDLAPQEQVAHGFTGLYRQLELVVEDAAGEVAPVALEHIDFRVPKSFVDGAGFEAAQAVLLHSVGDTWEGRATSLLGSEGAFYHYRALHGGRSTFAIVFDRLPPVVELLAPATASITGPVQVLATAFDDTLVKELVVTLADGTLLGSGTSSLDLLIDGSTLAQVVEGSLSITARAKDATGKAAQAVKVVALQRPATTNLCPDPTLDRDPPVTTLSYEGGDAARFGDILGIKGPVKVRFAARDTGLEACRDGAPQTHYRVDDGPVLVGSSVDIRADATHVLEYWSVDSKGNEESRQSLRIVPADGADPSAPGDRPPEPLEAPKRGLPGFEAALALAGLAAAGLALRRRRRA